MAECLDNLIVDEVYKEKEFSAYMVLHTLSAKNQQTCYNCGVDDTPLWRHANINNWWGEKMIVRLCNACGLRHYKHSCEICGGTYMRLLRGDAYCNLCNNKIV